MDSSAISIPVFLEDQEKKAAQQMTDDEILKELCAVNGIAYEKLQIEGSLIESLEVFFSGFPRFIPMSSHFPNLLQLCIIGQEVASIDSIGSLVRLEELWIAECKLKDMAGIRPLQDLVKLYMYGNQITKIENLDTLSNLEVLWLDNNKISVIEGLEGLVHLTELSLAENKIQSIGTSLNHCISLVSLQLSGNKIESFKDVVGLAKLPQLIQLAFNDCLYASNPVCYLCNYTTTLLYHMPNLYKLDGHDITTKPYKELSESTVIKKKIFYTMRLKVLQKNFQRFVRKMTEYKDQHVLKAMQEHLTTLHEIYKQLIVDVKVLEKTDDSQKEALMRQNQIKTDAIQIRILEWNKKCERIVSYFQHQLDMAQGTKSFLIERLCLELESGGNIRFETGLPSDPWFSSCFDLVLSRFCSTDYKDMGIQGVKIHRITRVYNRILRMRFDDKLAEHYPESTNVEGSHYRTQTIRKQIEYLFWVWDHELLGGQNNPSRILEEGFMDAESHLKLNKHGAVCLSNSLSLADKHRIHHARSNTTMASRLVEPVPHRHGQIVIAKAFVGRTEVASDNRMVKQQFHPNMNSVYRPKKIIPSAEPYNAAMLSMDQCGSPSQKRQSNETNINHRNREGKCDCEQRQCEWFVFDHELVVPEYLVEFEYVTTTKPKNPFQQFDCTLFESPTAFTSAPFADLVTSDEDVINLPPVTKSSQKKMESVTEEVLVRHCGIQNVTNLTELNLHNQGIVRISGIQALSSLRNLVLSFNEISKVDDLAYMSLESVDLSFNKITTLDGIKNMTFLKKLDISWNCMRYIRDEFAIIRKHLPALEDLNTVQNLWLKPTDFRLRVIGRVKSLRILDQVEITEAEATAALRLTAGSRVSQVQIMSHGRTDLNKVRSLSMQSVAQVMAANSHCLPDRGMSNDTQWMSKVTSLCLDNQHLAKLSNLEKLVSLKWASFCDNDIVKMEGLDCCQKLEELYLDNNCIYKLEGLTKLTHLRRLSLAENYIVQLDPCQLERLTHLHYLALDHNKLTSLHGIQKAKNLIELYLSQNRIANIRDVFYLKVMANILVLDLSENQLTSVENYRIFLIYHLPTLKACDGIVVDTAEVTQAREILGGRLTSDFIAERIGHSNFREIRELDLPQLSLRSIDLSSGEQFVNLRSINVEHNNLTTLGGLVNLPNLRVLCLNHNRIECIGEKPVGLSEYSSDKVIPLLESLEVLHLGYNGIKDLTVLQVSRLIGLKALFLQGNELQAINGLEGLHDLRELVLDKNKIKGIGETSFANQWNLEELHIEENRIRDLNGFHHLESLQRLYLGMNRIQDLSELEKLTSLHKLIELSLVSRRLMHRPLLVYRMDSLAIIDGIPVTDEEQMKASLYYMQQEQQQQLLEQNQQILPGISPTMATVKGQVPVKVTNVSLGGFGERTPWSGTLQFDNALLSQAEGKKRSTQTASVPQRSTNQSFNIQASYANNQQQSKNSFYSENPFGKTNRK